MTERTTVTTIGETIVFKGELSGDEDLVIDGQVEGKIDLNRNALTVGEHGKVKATVVAKTVVAAGKVRGNIIAAEKVDIRDTCSMEGNICAPRVVIALGAYFRGGIDMRQSQSGRAGRDARRRQRSGRAGQIPREGRSEAGVRCGQGCSRPEIVAAPSEGPWRYLWWPAVGGYTAVSGRTRAAARIVSRRTSV